MTRGTNGSSTAKRLLGGHDGSLLVEGRPSESEVVVELGNDATRSYGWPVIAGLQRPVNRALAWHVLCGNYIARIVMRRGDQSLTPAPHLRPLPDDDGYRR
jgi:hypothetical protein